MGDTLDPALVIDAAAMRAARVSANTFNSYHYDMLKVFEDGCLDDPKYLKGWITDEAKASYKQMISGLPGSRKRSSKLKKTWMKNILENCKTFRKEDGKTFLKSGAYQAKCSALGYLFSFHEGHVNGLPPRFAQELSGLKKGFFREIAKKAQDEGGGDLNGGLEGKRAMSEQLYQKCCQWFLEKGDASSIFCHTFLVLTWNLMCRSNNTCRILFEHISWYSDHLEIKFAQTKNDNLGQQQKYLARRLYANPLDPATCPVFALGLYLGTFSGTSSASDPLFSGKAPYTRFMTGLHKTLKENLDELVKLGYESEKDIGSHSIRKGATTWLSGQPGGPSVASICIRGGWTLGGVKDIYMTYKAEGDAFCGRMLSMLPLLQSEFAMGPPEIVDVEMSALQLHIESIFPSMAQMNHLKPLLLWCLAALVHSQQYVLDWPPSHIIRQQNELFRNETTRSELTGKCKVVYPWDNNENSFGYESLSGIPPHVKHTVELEKLQKEFKSFIDNFKNSIHEVFDDRNVSNGSMSRHQMREIVLETQDDLCNRLMEGLNLAGIGASAVTGGGSNSNALDPANDDPFGPHYHPNDPKKLWRLPFGYKFPKGTTQNLWKVWHVGDTVARIPPFKDLETKDFQCMKNDGNRPYRKVICDIRYLCKYIEKLATEKGFDVTSIESSGEANRILLSIASEENGLLDKNTKSARQIAWRTAVAKVQKLQRKKRPCAMESAVLEEEEDDDSDESQQSVAAGPRRISTRATSGIGTTTTSRPVTSRKRSRTSENKKAGNGGGKRKGAKRKKRSRQPPEDDGRDFLKEFPIPDVALGPEAMRRQERRHQEFERGTAVAIGIRATNVRDGKRTTPNADGTYTYNGGTSGFPTGKCSCTKCVDPTQELQPDSIHKCIYCKKTIHIDCVVKMGPEFCDPAEDKYSCGCRTMEGF